MRFFSFWSRRIGFLVFAFLRSSCLVYSLSWRRNDLRLGRYHSRDVKTLTMVLGTTANCWILNATLFPSSTLQKTDLPSCCFFLLIRGLPANFLRFLRFHKTQSFPNLLHEICFVFQDACPKQNASKWFNMLRLLLILWSPFKCFKTFRTWRYSPFRWALKRLIKSSQPLLRLAGLASTSSTSFTSFTGFASFTAKIYRNKVEAFNVMTRFHHPTLPELFSGEPLRGQRPMF